MVYHFSAEQPELIILLLLFLPCRQLWKYWTCPGASVGFGCCWQQLHNVGKVNGELGLLHGTSQVCEAVGKQSGNYKSLLQKLIESTKQQRIKQPSTAHALCNGCDSPKIPVASPYKYLHLWTTLSRFWWKNFTHLDNIWFSLFAWADLLASAGLIRRFERTVLQFISPILSRS